ncbi:MAG: FAD-dependent oxidoreductase [Armatimonadota bacterium]|nr:MAG: FAD-dependent oxidoreductase [Armatimonadota bacterium]
MQGQAIDEARYGPFEVVVAGGGMAGIAAAVAAGRTGAKTLLVEKAGWLGGMGITGATCLHNFFNVFGAHPGAERIRVVAGIAQDLVDRVGELGGGMGHIRIERGGQFVSMATPVEPEVFKLAAFQLCREAGVKLLMHTVVDEVRADGGRVEGIVVWNKAGRSLVWAKQYIDCTGDGDLAAYAGAEVEHFRTGDPGAYAAGFTFRLCNIDLDAMEADLERHGLIWHLAHAVKPGGSRRELVRMGLDMEKVRGLVGEQVPGYFFAVSVRPRELTYCNCINYGPNDGLDAEALTEAEVALRGQMFEVADLFRKHVAGCEECYVAGPAPSAGQRRGRAILCDYDLTQEDCTGGRQFEDQVGCFGFIDNPTFDVREAGAYGIPYRTLVPRKLDNVLIAGRMMSVDLVAHNSTRNTACCLVCGQAAGTAAAMAAAKGAAPREVEVGELRERLRADGALLEPLPDPIEEQA